MLGIFKNLFRRSSVHLPRSYGRGDSSRLRNPRFVSFMSKNGGFTPLYSDRYDSRLRRRKIYKNLLKAAVTAGAAWVVIESAHALTIF